MSDTLKSCNFMEYEELRVAQLGKKFFFYGTGWLMAELTRAYHFLLLEPYESTPHPHVLRFNSILSSTPRSFSVMFSN